MERKDSKVRKRKNIIILSLINPPLRELSVLYKFAVRNVPIKRKSLTTNK